MLPMPLQYQDQVSLLTDILTNHQTDCCGSVSECEQLERLIKSLLVNSNIDQNVKNVLEQVYSYSQNGINSNNLDNHIESHQQELSQWVENIDQLS
jgi:YtzH-like protein